MSIIGRGKKGYYDLLHKLLVRHEGSKAFAYRDSLGYLTIGVGRCIEKGVGRGLSELEIGILLGSDILEAEKWLTKNVSAFPSLDDARRAVLVDMYHNLGPVRLNKFKDFLAYIQTGSYIEAAKEMLDSKWAKQVGKRAEELSEMMKTGGFPPDL